MNDPGFLISKKIISFLILFLTFWGTVSSEPLSNFAFYNLKKERIVLSDSLREFSKKDILILNFTGSSCKPCKEQVPILLSLAKKANLSSLGEFRIRFWIVFVGDDFQTGKEYSKILKLEDETEILIDPLSSSYSQAKISGLPTVILLDQKQGILLKTEGYTEAGTNALENFLNSLGKTR
ncbi:thioredoxin family protein [Leptospira sp. 201903071]|uniref:TlpA family protein disulfide reductase n=1 Tax=Leptospira ainazelensis TaxID=2810034 RepID=UPI001962B034|nr:thioredoxin-like domain-containing protein [Leptospira ainazelensis]MBM9499056.1 thioredoxin family protein [Leptospira ainazelensis]